MRFTSLLGIRCNMWNSPPCSLRSGALASSQPLICNGHNQQKLKIDSPNSKKDSLSLSLSLSLFGSKRLSFWYSRKQEAKNYPLTKPTPKESAKTDYSNQESNNKRGVPNYKIIITMSHIIFSNKSAKLIAPSKM